MSFSEEYFIFEDDSKKKIIKYIGNEQRIVIPDGVETIGKAAFASSLALKEVKFNNEIKNIDNFEFFNCINLKMPDTRDALVAEDAFLNCSSLTSIAIPENVTNIGQKAFKGCSSLTNITIKALIPPSLGTTAIPSTISTIYVPANSVETYKAASGWKSFASKIQPIPE